MTTRKLIMSEWLYLLGVALGAIGIIAGGLAYRQEQLDDALEDTRVQELLCLAQHNREVLQALIDAPTVGHGLTACDLIQILSDLRGGKMAERYPLEERCR